jgi:hypothetical protein
VGLVLLYAAAWTGLAALAGAGEPPAHVH